VQIVADYPNIHSRQWMVAWGTKAGLIRYHLGQMKGEEEMMESGHRDIEFRWALRLQLSAFLSVNRHPRVHAPPYPFHVLLDLKDERT
jgi:hypothetical protein